MEIATRKGRMKSVVNKERRTEGINIDDSFFFFFSISIKTKSLFLRMFFLLIISSSKAMLFPSSIHFFIKVYRSDDKKCRRGYN